MSTFFSNYFGSANFSLSSFLSNVHELWRFKFQVFFLFPILKFDLGSAAFELNNNNDGEERKEKTNEETILSKTNEKKKILNHSGFCFGGYLVRILFGVVVVVVVILHIVNSYEKRAQFLFRLQEIILSFSVPSIVDCCRWWRERRMRTNQEEKK